MNRVQQLLQRLVAARAPHMDEESGTPNNDSVPPEVRSPSDPQMHGQDRRDTVATLNPPAPREYLGPEALEQLRTFRHLIGISTDKSLSAPGQLDTGRPGNRPAPNVGLYARVVHNEMVAKTGYKYYSILINSCLGLQIVVAAALTAMGAADTNHNAITAFGAINTVFAGFLTYLKGSGLPNRLKWNQNEWKKLREYIEQRERDLSRPSGAYLDVYAIVALIERMYDETKADIEVNTPDGYISVQNAKKRSKLDERPMSLVQESAIGSKGATHDASLDMLRTSSVNSKLKGLETSLAEKLHEADQTRQDLSKDAEKGEKTLSSRIQELRASIDDRVRDLATSIEHSTREVGRDVESQGRQTSSRAREVEHGAIQDTSREIQEHARRKIDELAARLSH